MNHCTDCDSTFSCIKSYNRHLLTQKHTLNSAKRECICGKRFLNRQSLFRHKSQCHIENKPVKKIPFELFLNETCKNAISLDAFMDKININDTDVKYCQEVGFTVSMVELYVRELSKYKQTERPIHCTDAKRETFHIKGQKWFKDTDSLVKSIRALANQREMYCRHYLAQHPKYNIPGTEEYEKSFALLKNIMGTEESHKRICQELAKVVFISRRT